MQTLEGKTAIVTGGARGIGAEIVSALQGLGARVASLDLGASSAELSLTADVGSYDEVRDAVWRAREVLGAPDVLVCNAGWDKVEPFLANDPALWDRLIAVNLRGVFNACHVIVPLMIENGGGRVVTVASDAGRVGSSGEAVYSACKGGVIAFTKSLAREVARDGVRVNCVCPGPTETPLLDEIRRGSEAGDKIIDAIVRATPTRKLAKPEEIAEAVAFFATCSEHVTGQVLSVSGGLTMAG